LSLPDAEEIRRAGGALFSDLGPGFGKAAFSTAESTSGGPDPAGGSERHTPSKTIKAAAAAKAGTSGWKRFMVKPFNDEANTALCPLTKTREVGRLVRRC
jgi:hypothetical protein